MTQHTPTRPTAAFVGASWAALLAGCLAFVVGLWNAHLALSEKGYYLTILLYGLFAAVAVQKNVRDLAAAGPEADPLPEPYPPLDGPSRLAPPR